MFATWHSDSEAKLMTDTTDTASPHIAITGAAGYIGSRVVTELQETHPD